MPITQEQVALLRASSVVAAAVVLIRCWPTLQRYTTYVSEQVDHPTLRAWRDSVILGRVGPGETCTLDLKHAQLTARDWSVITRVATSTDLRDAGMVVLDFGSCNIGAQGITALCSILCHPACPAALRISLAENRLGSALRLCAMLGDVLRGGSCRCTDLTLDLSRNGMGSSAAAAVCGFPSTSTQAQPLEGMHRLALVLDDNPMGDEGVCAVGQAVYSGCLPADTLLSVRKAQSGMRGCEALCEGLTSPGCPQHLTLDIGFGGLMPSCLQRLFDTLCSGQCRDRLSLVLDGVGLGSDGCRLLGECLMTGSCPPSLSLSLRANGIDAGAARFLSESLATGMLPARLRLDLAFNPLGEEGLRHFKEAVATGNTPHHASIVLGSGVVL